MRRFTFAVAFMLVAIVSFSQNVIAPHQLGAGRDITGVELNRAPVDTMMWDEFGITSAIFYSYTGGGYVFGVNIEGSTACAQGFLNFTPGLYIESVLIWVGALYDIGGNSDLKISLNLLDDSSSYGPTGGPYYDIRCPGTELGSVTLPYTSMDTTDFVVATFSAPVHCSTDFAVVADVSDYYPNGDTIGFVTSDDGVASTYQGNDLTYWMYPASPSFWTEYTHVFGGADNLIAFFPVISDFIGMVENSEFVNGLKLSQNYPNPSVNGTTTISYALQTSSDVTLTVFDQNGRTVEVVNPGNQAAGVYNVTLNNQLSAGVYYYSLNACGSRLTKKMVIK